MKKDYYGNRVISFLLCILLLISILVPTIYTVADYDDTEPVFNASQHQIFDITDYGNGVFSEGVLTVGKGSNSYFKTLLENDADYYMTVTVKTNDSLNVGYRTNDGYFHIQKNCYRSVGTNGAWINKAFPKLTTGIRITVYSAKDKVAVWVDGEKLIDEAYTASGKVNPGITWSFSDTAYVSDILIWTEKEQGGDLPEPPPAVSDEPVFDSEKHTEYTVNEYSGGSFADNLLTIPAQTASSFKTELLTDADYYMTVKVKTNDSLNVGYRTNDGYFHIEKNCYRSVGTNGAWINKAFPKLTTGIRITVYSAKDKVAVWVDGEKLIDEAYTASGKVNPGITWSFSDTAYVSDILIWAEKEQGGEVPEPPPIVSDEPIFDSEKHIKHEVLRYTNGVSENSVLKLEKLSKAYFETNLTPDAAYYMTLNVKTASGINVAYRAGESYINIQKNGYQSRGTDEPWVNKPLTGLADGLKVTLYSSPDKIQIWLDGEKIVDKEYTRGDNALPGISWTFDGAAEVKDVVIWTETALITDEPKYDSEFHELITVNKYNGGEFKKDVLKLEPLSSSKFESDLKYDSDYYFSFRIKTAGGVNIGYREPNGFINLQANGYKTAGVGGEWINKPFPLLATGIRVTVFSGKDHTSIWVGGEKLVDTDYKTEEKALPGIYWSFNETVTVSDMLIWKIKEKDEDVSPNISDEPKYDEKVHVIHEVEGFTNGKSKNGVLKLDKLSKAYFETDLTPDAAYYMTLNVKTLSGINVAYRAGESYINIQKNGYQSRGTDEPWVNKYLPLEDGLRVTLYSSPERIKIWLDGYKVIDNEYTRGDNALPGISWTFDSMAEIKDIIIWTESVLTTDEPEFDSKLHDKVEIEGCEGGNYTDGVLTVEPLSSAIFKTDLAYNQAYYISFRIKTSGGVNIGYREPNGFINLQANGYQSSGTEDKWVEKSFPLLASGIDVTLYSSGEHISIWIGGEKIVDKKYTSESEALPGIYWSFDDTVTVSDICIWRLKQEKQEYLGEIEMVSSQRPVSSKGTIVHEAEEIEEKIYFQQTVGQNYTPPESVLEDAKVEVINKENTKAQNYTVFIILLCVITVFLVLVITFFTVKKIKK